MEYYGVLVITLTYTIHSSSVKYLVSDLKKVLQTANIEVVAHAK